MSQQDAETKTRHLKLSPFKKAKLAIEIAGILAFTVSAWTMARPAYRKLADAFPVLRKHIAVTSLISPEQYFPEMPTEVPLLVSGQKSAEAVPVSGVVQYSVDQHLQSAMKDLLDQYHPDHAAFVAMDPTTGRILALLSTSRDPSMTKDFAMRASFPAASIFKVVTASAAISAKNFSAGSVVPFNGANHTLYRRNVLKNDENRWTRRMTLREAFGKSVNTVFAKIGAFIVGQNTLQDFANRFGFNQQISVEIPVQRSIAQIPMDHWGIAEAASGYTRDIKMSPIQGCLIASAIANDGTMMQPFLVQSILTEGGERLYEAEPKVMNQVMDPTTAREVRGLMEATVSEGTSRKTFRGFDHLKQVDVQEYGGKTGSLSGLSPKGKYDWFIGYARNGDRRIAVAVLTVHEAYWRVKSSYLARKAFEAYFYHPKFSTAGATASTTRPYQQLPATN